MTSEVETTIKNDEFIDRSNLTNILQGRNGSKINLNTSCYEFMKCDQVHLNISTIILTFGVIALLENLLLFLAMATWDLKKSCRMFWFLWHLSLADAILAISFIYFHIRIITSCPTPFSCLRSYQTESMIVFVGFFGPITASHLFITAATMDRFIAIKWSFHYQRIVTTTRSRITAAVIWLLSFLAPLAGVTLIVTLNGSLESYSAIVIMTSSVCLLCAGCVIGMNIWLISFAWTRIKTIHTLHDGRRSPGSLMSDLENYQDELKLAVTLTLFVFSFVLSCAPWSIALITCRDIRKCSLKRDEDYTLVLVLFHAIVIPILYGFRVQAVKSCVMQFWKNLLHKVTCCSRYNQK